MSTTAAVVPVEEYLNTDYHPDRDYVDGRLEKRHVGKYPHSRLQIALAMYLNQNAERFRIQALPEMRVRVSLDPPIYRVADICCVRAEPEHGEIITEPPVLVIEILSPKDTVQQTEDRIHDYLAMGVPFAWMINPKKLERAWIYEPREPRREVRDRILTAGEIVVNLNDLPQLRSFK